MISFFHIPNLYLIKIKKPKRFVENVTTNTAVPAQLS